MVIDVERQPELARQHLICAVPALIQTQPAPVRRFVGDVLGRRPFLASLKSPHTEGFDAEQEALSIVVATDPNDNPTEPPLGRRQSPNGIVRQFWRLRKSPTTI